MVGNGLDLPYGFIYENRNTLGDMGFLPFLRCSRAPNDQSHDILELIVLSVLMIFVSPSRAAKLAAITAILLVWLWPLFCRGAKSSCHFSIVWP